MKPKFLDVDDSKKEENYEEGDKRKRSTCLKEWNSHHWLSSNNVLIYELYNFIHLNIVILYSNYNYVAAVVWNSKQLM